MLHSGVAQCTSGLLGASARMTCQVKWRFRPSTGITNEIFNVSGIEFVDR
jgi:hypothetical protein